jgi:uncharacterized protein
MTQEQAMSHENAALIQALYGAFSLGDIDAVLEHMSPGIIWNEAENHPYADGNPYVGRQAVLQGIFARLGEQWDGFELTIDEILAAEDLVVALGRYHGAYKATGRKQNAQLVHVWRVVDAKIVSFQQFTDTLQIARVMAAV